MPFTFAHPAIVLPFGLIKKKWVSLTGLIIGSMSPDFEYFFRMRIRSDISHTIPGLLLFDLPASLLIAFIFHQLIKPALLPNLPSFLASRFIPFALPNWPKYFKSNLVVVIISILIGAASHILWDSFTHIDGYFVKHLTSLQKIAFADIPVYKILQHGSTMLGLLAIAITIYALPKSNYAVRKTSAKITYWLITLLAAFFVISIYLLMQNSVPATGNLVVACISTGFIGIITASVFYSLDFTSHPGKNQRL